MTRFKTSTLTVLKLEREVFLIWQPVQNRTKTRSDLSWWWLRSGIRHVMAISNPAWFTSSSVRLLGNKLFLCISPSAKSIHLSASSSMKVSLKSFIFIQNLTTFTRVSYATCIECLCRLLQLFCVCLPFVYMYMANEIPILINHDVDS